MLGSESVKHPLFLSLHNSGCAFERSIHTVVSRGRASSDEEEPTRQARTTRRAVALVVKLLVQKVPHEEDDKREATYYGWPSPRSNLGAP